MKQMKTGILASVATSFLMCALGAAAAGVPPATNDWFDANFTALTAGTSIAQGGTLGITSGAGSWTAVPATGTAVIAADADAGGEATMLSIAAPGEELTLTPALFSATTGLETVSVQLKADAMDELPEIGDDVQAAFTVYLDENDALSVRGWTAAGWTNLVYDNVGSLTNAWATFTVDLRNSGGVRQVRYSVTPSSGSLAVLGDSSGTTWFHAGAEDAETINSVSLSGTGSCRLINGDSIEVTNVATYNGAAYQTVAEAIAVALADGFSAGAVMLLDDAAWTPTAIGAYLIDVNGHTLTIEGDVV